MFDRLRSLLLRMLKVPPEPEPPLGASGSVRVFRAGRNYYKLRLLGWGFAQLGAIVGIVVSLGFLDHVEQSVNEKQKERSKAAARAPGAAAATNSPTLTFTNPSAASPGSDAIAQAPSASQRNKARAKQEARELLGRVVQKSPSWIFPALALLEYVGLAIYFFQAALTYALLRLDYEMRWYVVTDRSLRIRSGTWSVQEMTMSFANLQQVMLSQGPVQRFLGIADIRVESAGGGGGMAGNEHGTTDSMHTGFFHGVENANEVRDLILERLRHFRETGLGDPDEARSESPAQAGVVPGPVGGDVLEAARGVLTEARALRSALATGPGEPS